MKECIVGMQVHMYVYKYVLTTKEYVYIIIMEDKNILYVSNDVYYLIPDETR